MAASIRAEHVGILLRSAELLRARAEHAAGTLSLEKLREAEDRAIFEIFGANRGERSTEIAAGN